MQGSTLGGSKQGVSAHSLLRWEATVQHVPVLLVVVIVLVVLTSRHRWSPSSMWVARF